MRGPPAHPNGGGRTGRLVPERLALPSTLLTACRRMGGVGLVTSLMMVAFIVLYVLTLDGSRLTIALASVITALQFVIYLICTRTNLGPRRATDIGLVLLTASAWLASAIHHFGYEGRIDMFTAGLFPLLILPIFAGVGPSRFVLVGIAMAFGQPVMGAWSYVEGATFGSLRDLWFSVAGASFAAGVALSGCYLMQAERREGAREIGGYRLVRRIGRGGMGEVWEGRHRFLATPAAIKLLRPSHPSSYEARFEREAQATAVLTSEHTVRLFDFGRAEDDRFYYVMELLEGADLQQVVEEHGPLSPDHVVSLMMQVCDSIGEAHERGLVHRDIKPSNLFLARRGLQPDFVKVLDFGLVAYDDEVSDQQQEPFLGTAAYAAPEALRGEPQNARTDVYQLGCVMFFLLTGRPVFDAPNRIAMALAHAAEAPPRVGRLSRDPIPADLEHLIARCLAKDPVQRPGSAVELQGELERLECFGLWGLEQGARYFDSISAPTP